MSHESLFTRRLKMQWHTFSRYLRYVFNDHAVLAFFFLIGALGLAYRSLWQQAPVNIWTQISLTLLLVLTLYIFKTPANFLKDADPIFMLGDELRIRKLFTQATRYSMFVNGLIEAGLILLLWPMMLRLYTTSFIIIGFITIVFIIIKITITYVLAQHVRRFNTTSVPEMINWRALVTYENRRQNSILAFFNLFIDVPGQKPKIRRLHWADNLIKHWPQHKNPLVKLLITSFLRQTQYSGTWLRLTMIGIVLGGLTNGWLQTFLYVILLYLMIIQLLPIMSSHQQNVFDHIFPISIKQRQQAFRIVVLPFILLTIILWSGVAFIVTQDSTHLCQNIIILVVVVLILVCLYTDRKIANTFKRRHSRAFTK